MTGSENYFGFLAAGILLNMTPGPDTLYILTKSIVQGKKAGMVSVLGISTGALVHILLASFGLSLILTRSILIFRILQFTGVAYLLFLGLKTMIQKPVIEVYQTNDFREGALPKIYFQAILTNLLNPKVALFFLSFLPQFIRPTHSHSSIPFLILGFTFFTTGLIWCVFLVLITSWITKKLRENTQIQPVMQKISGSIFILLGLHLAIKNH